MEGGITVILTLIILFAAIAGGVALFGAGGFVRKREMEGELDDDEPRGRPTHNAVEDDSRDVQFPREPSSRTQGPE
ncbi:MAG TPA: hypothetical protein VG474_16065 [Solirubrobacteraceae bacterium]|nr:hypothetical protein [Solirubrobacteraceae bacterium]